MKLSVLQENIDQALSIVSHVVATNNPIEILDNILLQTKDGRLELQATNLEIAVSVQVGAKIEQAGSITVPARLFSEFIHSLPKDKLQLSCQKDVISIQTHKNQSTINGVNAEDFPKAPVITSENEFVIERSILLEALESVLPCVSIDDSRPILAGILLSISDGKILCAATDSYRLAEWSIPFKSDLENLSVILPHRSILELIRIIKIAEPEEINVSLSSSEVVFTFSDIQFISQLTEGQYPDYTKIIPKDSTTEAVIDKQECITGVKTTALFVRSNAQTLQLSIEKNTIALQADAESVGTSSSSIEAKVTGEDLQISLNAKYILDVLSAISAKKIQCSFRTKLEPCLIRPISTQKSKQLYIIMPLKS